jgi:hypothetical protein
MDKKFNLKVITMLLLLANIFAICIQLVIPLERWIAFMLDGIWLISEIYILFFVYINLFYPESKETNIKFIREKK